MLTFETAALWHPNAGVLDSELAVNTMLNLAVAEGAVLRQGWEMAQLERSGRGFVVTSTIGEALCAAGVIVCAGGWLPDLLTDLPVPASMRLKRADLAVRQEQVYHFPYREEIAPAADWLTVIHLFEETDVYALPGGGDAGFRGQKVAPLIGELAAGLATGTGTVPEMFRVFR